THTALTFKSAKLGERAVRIVGESYSHTAIAFDTAAPGRNVVLRPNTSLPGTERLCAWLLTDPVFKPAGPPAVAADVGFAGGATGNQAKVRLFCYKVDLDKPKAPVPVILPAWKGVSGVAPMVPLEQAVPADAPGEKPYRLLVGIEVQDFFGDPA